MGFIYYIKPHIATNKWGKFKNFKKKNRGLSQVQNSQTPFYNIRKKKLIKNKIKLNFFGIK